MTFGDGFGCSIIGSGIPWYTLTRFGGGSNVAMVRETFYDDLQAICKVKETTTIRGTAPSCSPNMTFWFTCANQAPIKTLRLA